QFTQPADALSRFGIASKSALHTRQKLRICAFGFYEVQDRVGQISRDPNEAPHQARSFPVEVLSAWSRGHQWLGQAYGTRGFRKVLRQPVGKRLSEMTPHSPDTHPGKL